MICQDPIVRITDSDPDVVYDNVMYATRGEDVTMSCFVENLPLDTLVRVIFAKATNVFCLLSSRIYFSNILGMRG